MVAQSCIPAEINLICTNQKIINTYIYIYIFKKYPPAPCGPSGVRSHLCNHPSNPSFHLLDSSFCCFIVYTLLYTFSILQFLVVMLTYWGPWFKSGPQTSYLFHVLGCISFISFLTRIVFPTIQLADNDAKIKSRRSQAA